MESTDRITALREANRVLRPGGLVLAFTITNYASTIVGITQGWVWDNDYLSMCEGEITAGDHVRPASWPSLFSTAYFHHPRHIIHEIEESGFKCEGIFGIEGPGWMVPDFEANWRNEERREAILRIARQTECDPVLSPHNMTVGRKQ